MFYNWTTPPPWYGLAYLGLGHIASSADPTGVGAQRVEGESRGYLARLLEANGFQQRSMAEWQRAAQFLGKSMPTEVRRFIERLRQVRNSEDYRRAEEVVLGER
jgi:hypothetical protein